MVAVGGLFFFIRGPHQESKITKAEKSKAQLPTYRSALCVLGPPPRLLSLSLSLSLALSPEPETLSP